MKKIIAGLLLLPCIINPAIAVAFPPIFHSIHEQYKQNRYTSKVIGGACCILAGMAIAYKRNKRSAPNLIFSLGMTMTGAALLKSAYHEAYSLSFTPHNRPLYYCDECKRNVRANSQSKQTTCALCNRTTTRKIPLPEREAFNF